jgi:hypothetical protein
MPEWQPAPYKGYRWIVADLTRDQLLAYPSGINNTHAGPPARVTVFS